MFVTQQTDRYNWFYCVGTNVVLKTSSLENKVVLYTI